MFIKTGRSRICTDFQTPEEKQAHGDLAAGSIPAASDGSIITPVVITNTADELTFLLLLLPGLQRSPCSQRDLRGRRSRQSEEARGDYEGDPRKLISLSLLRLRGDGGWWRGAGGAMNSVLLFPPLFQEGPLSPQGDNRVTLQPRHLEQK